MPPSSAGTAMRRRRTAQLRGHRATGVWIGVSSASLLVISHGRRRQRVTRLDRAFIACRYGNILGGSGSVRWVRLDTARAPRVPTHQVSFSQSAILPAMEPRRWTDPLISITTVTAL